MTITLEHIPGMAGDMVDQNGATPPLDRPAVPTTRPAPAAADVIAWDDRRPAPVPAPTRPAAWGPGRSRSGLGGPRPWALRLWALLLVGGVQLAAAVEPAPDGPKPVQPGWVVVAGNVAMTLLLVAVVALLCARPWGLGAATYGTAGLFLLAVLCPTSGHHAMAAWWFGQLAICAGLLAGSLALRSRAARPKRAP
jgi:hypothetical protein